MRRVWIIVFEQLVVYRSQSKVWSQYAKFGRNTPTALSQLICPKFSRSIWRKCNGNIIDYINWEVESSSLIRWAIVVKIMRSIQPLASCLAAITFVIIRVDWVPSIYPSLVKEWLTIYRVWFLRVSGLFFAKRLATKIRYFGVIRLL